MKIDMSPLSNAPGYRFFMRAISCDGAYRKIDQLDFSSDNKYEHDVKLTIDGVEFNIEEFIRKLDSDFESAVKCEAGEMYVREFDDRSEIITKALSDFSEELRRIRRDKFPDIRWANDPDYLYDD